MKRCLVFLLLLLCGTLQAVPDTYVILPGEGFGPYKASLGAPAIEKLVKPEEFGEGEMGGLPSATIFMMEPKKRITIIFGEKRRIKTMSVRGLESVWHTREGITLGTTLATLEKLNGKAFRFQSFEGERSGEILDWGGGKLTRSMPRVKVIFASPMHAKGYGKLTGEEKLGIEKEGTLSSSDPAARKLNPVVYCIELAF
ncbi:MAG: hypothetical protein RDV48_18930 [Candidatus Eremiobacteraeota bacterium]|nr:hypothetical protein [Candidatus Eremiobacteraeota bacterium]